MIEQYVLDELKSLKRENETLKEELIKKQNEKLQLIDVEPYHVKLLDKELVIKKLIENGVNIEELYNEKNSKERAEIIKELELYVKTFPKDSDIIATVKYNDRYYEFKKYYNEFRCGEEVHLEIEKAIYHEIEDTFCEYINSYLKEMKKQEKINNE